MAAWSDDRPLGVPSGTTCHPAYLKWAPIWRTLADILEGDGGFLDGTYLVPHPREWRDHSVQVPQGDGKESVWQTNPNPTQPTAKLLERRKLARYENVAQTLLNTKRAAIFREPIVRTVGRPDKTKPHPLEVWWQNVDGQGTHIADYMGRTFIGAAGFGHLVHLMDRPPGPRPRTKADERPPFLRPYSPLDVVDWLHDDMGQLVAVKIIEAVGRKSLDEQVSTTAARERIVDQTRWRITRENGQEVNRSGEHRMGTLPVVIQYGRRRALADFIGQSVLGDPKLYVDLYNLTSEIRELLRKQTFGHLNIPLGTGDNAVSVEAAIRMLGQSVGTDSVLFSPAAAAFIQPDSANVTIYQQERDYLLRNIYRTAQVPWESDSRDAESEGSLRLKREDMNQDLAALADECERAEYGIARLFFRAFYGPDRWQQEWDDADVVIRYPDSFDATPFAEILEQAQAALTIDIGPQAMRELRRRLVRRFIPDATQDVFDAIDKELEDMAKREKDMTSESAIKKMRATLEKFGADPATMAA